MFQRFSLLLLLTVAVLSQACRSIPDSERAGDGPSKTIERQANTYDDSDNTLTVVTDEISEDFKFRSKSETPVSKGVFYTGAVIGAVPLIPFVLAAEWISETGDSALKAPEAAGVIVGSTLAAPFYLIEKPVAKVSKAVSKSSRASKS